MAGREDREREQETYVREGKWVGGFDTGRGERREENGEESRKALSWIVRRVEQRRYLARYGRAANV